MGRALTEAERNQFWNEMDCVWRETQELQTAVTDFQLAMLDVAERQMMLGLDAVEQIEQLQDRLRAVWARPTTRSN